MCNIVGLVMAVPFHFEEVDEIDVIRQQLQAILSLLANRPRTMHQQTSTAQSSNHHQGNFITIVNSFCIPTLGSN